MAIVKDLSLTQRRISDLTECTLCLSTYRLPKCLPCIHTFCLDCLESYVDKCDNRAEIRCPLCRERFTIPADGVKGLRDNFHIKSISELAVPGEANTKADEGIPCYVCTQRNKCEENEINHESGPSSSVAVKYCSNCDQNLCKVCVENHNYKYQFRRHKLSPVKDREESISAPKLSQNLCDKHPNEILRLYCIECKVIVCVMCLVEDHNGHKSEEITKASANLRDTITTKTVDLDEVIEELDISMQNLRKHENDIVKKAESADCEIKKICSEFRRKIDVFEGQLLKDSQIYKDDCLSKCQDLLRKVEFEYMILCSFKTQQEEITSKKSGFEVAREADEFLSNLDQELIKVKQELRKNLEMERFNYPEFCTAGISMDKNFIGVFIPKYFDTSTGNRTNHVFSQQINHPVPPPLPIIYPPTPLSGMSPYIASTSLTAPLIPRTSHPGAAYIFEPVSNVRPPIYQQAMYRPSPIAKPRTTGYQPICGAPRPFGSKTMFGPPIMRNFSSTWPWQSHSVGQSIGIVKSFTTQQPMTVPWSPPVNTGNQFFNAEQPLPMNSGSQFPLTQSLLSEFPPPEQKLMIGERLYPLIYGIHPELAGKITGMLLEIDNSELLLMLESRGVLNDKVEEAISVLDAHYKAQENPF